MNTTCLCRVDAAIAPRHAKAYQAHPSLLSLSGKGKTSKRYLVSLRSLLIYFQRPSASFLIFSRVLLNLFLSLTHPRSNSFAKSSRFLIRLEYSSEHESKKGEQELHNGNRTNLLFFPSNT